MLKLLFGIVVLAVLSLLSVSYFYGRALRSAGIIEGRSLLKVAAKDFAEYGYVTNVSSSSHRFWRSTNVVTIGGTQFQCYAEIGGGKLGNAGTLAITTNHTFIWLDNQRPPKIIDAGYRPPVFPPRF